MRLYLDNYVYNRPFDNQRIPRNREESRAVEALLEKVGAGEVVLVSSFVVEAEHALSPSGIQRSQVGALIHGTTREYVMQVPSLVRRAHAMERHGLAGRDALHLAAAEHAAVDYFVTCDDKLLKRARRLEAQVDVVAPLGSFEEGVI